jgi:hypothetical protein
MEKSIGMRPQALLRPRKPTLPFDLGWRPAKKLD